ncbi:ABC transporter substrate-binding protein [Marinobacter sp. MMG032]|uniref:ABC transporter substrate-binding protein n=1 Tax=Marinobacter sp. MMG032 TaxID=3158548 RepID=A0AAU7MS13_9GAMM
MTMIKDAVAVALAGSVLAGCAAISDVRGPTVISYDHGALDTLMELGVGEKVLAIPHQGLPDYLSELGHQLPDAGSLKVPELAAIETLQPDLVLMTGRQSEAVEEVAELTRVKDVTLPQGTYQEAVTARVLELSRLYGLDGRAEEKLDALWDYVNDRRAEVAGAGRVTVVTHNEGKFSLRDEPVVYELLELTPAKVPDTVKPVSRGTRTFYPVTPETLAHMDPRTLLVVDRSAAIGAAPLDQARLQEQLKQSGATTRVVILNPGLWYLSGGGLQSIRLQVNEVLAAVEG